MKLYPIPQPNKTSVIESLGEACNDSKTEGSSIVSITQAKYRQVLANPDITYIQLQEIDKLLESYPDPEYPLIQGIEKLTLSGLQTKIMRCDRDITGTYKKYVKSFVIEFKRKFEVALRVKTSE